VAIIPFKINVWFVGYVGDSINTGIPALNNLFDY